MEFCPRTLHQVLEAGPLMEEDAWQVCNGGAGGIGGMCLCMPYMWQVWRVYDCLWLDGLGGGHFKGVLT